MGDCGNEEGLREKQKGDWSCDYIRGSLPREIAGLINRQSPPSFFFRSTATYQHSLTGKEWCEMIQALARRGSQYESRRSERIGRKPASHDLALSLVRLFPFVRSERCVVGGITNRKRSGSGQQGCIDRTWANPRACRGFTEHRAESLGIKANAETTQRAVSESHLLG